MIKQTFEKLSSRMPRVFRPRGTFDRKRFHLQQTAADGLFNHDTCEIVQGFRITKHDTVIDVGCGDGGASQFASRCGARVIATDVDARKVDMVRTKLKHGKSPYEVFVSDSNPLPLQDNVGTRVICQEVLEHVDDPAQVMGELVRVAKPNAQLLVSVPDPTCESLQRKIAAPDYWKRPNHLRVFQRDEFDQLICQAGLTIEKRLHLGFYWSLWWTFFWACDQEVGGPEQPLLDNWSRTWHELMKSPHAARIQQALDECLPKSQVIIARKAA